MTVIERQIKKLTELEAIFELAELRASTLKKECHKARQKLAGVSTSASAQKGYELTKAAASLIAKRNSKIQTK